MNKPYAILSIVAAFGLTGCGQPAEEGAIGSEKEETTMSVVSNCPEADESGSIQIAPG